MSAPVSGEARVLMKDVAYEHIRTRILDGTFASGSFISERDLSAELEMSKTPIRAAFERLSEQGFVTIAPQRGVIVRDLTPREIADHYDIRIALETFVVRELSGRLTPAQRGRLEEILAEQAEQVSGEIDIRGFRETDTAFHLALTDFLGNDEIIRVMVHQRARVALVVERIYQRDPEVPACSHREHQAIYEAIRDGDADRARAEIERHLQNGKRFLLLGGPYGREA